MKDGFLEFQNLSKVSFGSGTSKKALFDWDRYSTRTGNFRGQNEPAREQDFSNQTNTSGA